MNKHITYALFTLGLSAFLFSCSSDADIAGDIENGLNDKKKTCELIMNADRAGFEDEPATRSAQAWANGDVVYLIFEGSSNYGEAIYNNGKWTLSYYGSISSGSGSCQAVYIENVVSETGSNLNLDQNSVIYEAENAIYAFDGGSMTVSASLTPKTGRIRFDGDSNTAFKLYGISVYTTFNTSTGQFNLTPGMLNSVVSGSSTPYIYGVFSDTAEPRVNVIYPDAAFTKSFSTAIYQPGQSGYVSLPTAGSHIGWRNHAVFKVKGVEFAMIPVKYSEGNFLLAETETTEELFYVVMNSGNSSKLPKTGVDSYSTTSFENFCTKLSQTMKLDFRYPSTEEWQFAFKGGSKSQGYKYSGSNDIYEVAWFSGNSNREKHEVKQLNPNELGFYDMSGNVYELTKSAGYGGDSLSYENSCTIDSRTYSTYSCGLRLAISNN